MRYFGKIMMGLAALATLPLAAQGPAPRETPSEPAAASVQGADPSRSETAELDAADLEAWLDGFLPYALARGGVAGAVVVVVRGDETVLQKGYGYADVADREPVDPDRTLFRPGSVSKLLTWTAVMQMVEAGRLDLDTVLEHDSVVDEATLSGHGPIFNGSVCLVLERACKQFAIGIRTRQRPRVPGVAGYRS